MPHQKDGFSGKYLRLSDYKTGNVPEKFGYPPMEKVKYNI